MKKIFFILFLICNAFALQISIDNGKENNNKFSILTIKSESKIPCKSIENINNKNILIECEITKNIDTKFIKQKTKFFDIDYKKEKNKLLLLVKPIKNQSLFPNFIDLKNDVAIPEERPTTSKIWQVIGYENEIPFLSQNKYSGINFPIKIPNTSLPYFRELNLDSKPITYDIGPDLNIILNIKKLYENKKYLEVIANSNEFLNTYKDSLFIKDVLLFRIRALSESNLSDDVVEISKKWIKEYASDKNIPEILFLMAKNYSKLRIYNEANYYYNRIIDEYPDSKYVQYALVGLANNFAINGDKKQPNIFFARAYEGAKDVDVASYALEQWGNYNLNNDKEYTKTLYKRIINSNPKYFSLSPKESYENFKALAEANLYEIAALGAQSMLENYENIDADFKEKLIFDIGKWYELAGNADMAHKFNLAFLEEFSEGSNKDAVRLRDDNLLFNINEINENKKIESYEYIINKYPNTPNAEKAAMKKAELLMQMGKYEDVINMKNLISSEMLKEAYKKIIETKEDCSSIIQYYLESKLILVTNNSSKVYECLFESKIYEKASNLSQEKLNNLENENLETKLEWLYNNGMANYMLRDYNKSIKASRDAFLIAKQINKKQNIGIILFLGLANMDRKNEAMELLDELIKIFDNKKEMIEVYYKLLQWALEGKDNIASEKYAKKVIALQNKYNIHTYSPYVELNLADILFNDNQYTQTLEITKNIFSYNLNDNEKQKIHYINASSMYELGDKENAKKSFEKCININADNAFGKLCSEALNII